MKPARDAFEEIPSTEEAAENHDLYNSGSKLVRLTADERRCPIWAWLGILAVVVGVSLLALQRCQTATVFGLFRGDDYDLQTATVRIPFEVEPYHDFQIVVDVDARKYFPADDIFIKTFKFIGVEVDSDMIPFHTDAYADTEETILREDVLYTFHHSLLHQGHQRVYENEKNHIDFHKNAAIVHGTHRHTTFFGDFGVRLQPDTRIFACQHGWNRSDKTKTFTTVWEIEYQQVEGEARADDNQPTIDSSAAHTEAPKRLKPLVVGWFHTRLPNRAQLNEHYVLTYTLKVQKDLRMVGWIYHHHPWLYRVDAFDSNNATIWSHDGSPSDDGSLSFFPQPIEMPATATLTFVVHGKATFKGDLTTPASFTAYVDFPDGSDRVEEGPEEIFTVSEHVEHVVA